MKLNDTQQGKTDPMLREALEKAKDTDLLRTLMLLSGEDEEHEDWSQTHSQDPTPSSSQFSTAEDYRGALIEQQKARVARSTGKTIQALLDLSLKPMGGTISRAVVVEGKAQQIAMALELPGVSHAILDRPITLVQPKKPSAKPKKSKK